MEWVQMIACMGAWSAAAGEFGHDPVPHAQVRCPMIPRRGWLYPLQIRIPDSDANTISEFMLACFHARMKT